MGKRRKRKGGKVHVRSSMARRDVIADYYARLRTFDVPLPIGTMKEQWQGPLKWQGVEHKHYIVLQHERAENRCIRIEMHFTINEYTFIKYDMRGNYMQRSIIYGSRDRAMVAFHRELETLRGITWVETVSLVHSPVPQATPPPP